MTPFDLVVDEKRHTVKATLRGFWDMATASSYLVSLTNAAARVSHGNARSWWLIDIGGQVQAPEVAETMGRKLPGILPSEAAVAVLIDSGLLAIQVKRVVANERHRHFFNLEDARRWLTEQGMPA